MYEVSRTRVFASGFVFPLFFMYVVVESLKYGLDTNNIFLVAVSILSLPFIVISESLAYRAPPVVRSYLMGVVLGVGAGLAITPIMPYVIWGLVYGGVGVGSYIVSYLPSPHILNVFYGFVNALIIHFAIYGFRSFLDGLNISLVTSYRKTPSLTYGLLYLPAVFFTSIIMFLSVCGFIYLIYLSIVLLPLAILLGLLVSAVIAIGAYMLVRFVFTPLTNLMTSALGELGDGAIIGFEDLGAVRGLITILFLLQTFMPLLMLERYFSITIALSLLIVAGGLSTVSSIAPVARRIRMLMTMISESMLFLAIVTFMVSSTSSYIIKTAVELAIAHLGVPINVF